MDYSEMKNMNRIKYYTCIFTLRHKLSNERNLNFLPHHLLLQILGNRSSCPFGNGYLFLP